MPDEADKAHRSYINDRMARIEVRHDHMEDKIDNLDNKYATKDAVNALHKKAFDNTKSLGELAERLTKSIAGNTNKITEIVTELKHYATNKAWVAGVVASVVGALIVYIITALIP